MTVHKLQEQSKTFLAFVQFLYFYLISFTPAFLEKETLSGRRVRSWLRMNAGGAPNTCKSNDENIFGYWISGERVSNAWATYPQLRDSKGKLLVIPDNLKIRHLFLSKDLSVEDGPASRQLDGGVKAHHGNYG